MKDRWWLILFVLAAIAHYAADIDSNKILIGLGIFYVFFFMAKIESQATEISALKRKLADLEKETAHLAQRVTWMR